MSSALHHLGRIRLDDLEELLAEGVFHLLDVLGMHDFLERVQTGDLRALDEDVVRGPYRAHTRGDARDGEIAEARKLLRDDGKTERLENSEKPRLPREHGFQDERVQDDVLDLRGIGELRGHELPEAGGREPR